MKNNAKDYSYSNLNSALIKSLIKRIPPKEFSPLIEEIIFALNENLFKGDIELSMEKSSPPDNINSEGWPIAHKEALNKSGWLNGDFSPLILEGNKLSWRRWHKAMNEILNELIVRSNTSRNSLSDSGKLFNSKNDIYLNKDQMKAVNSVVNQNLILISGGPGTGKTSTVIRIIEKALANNTSIRVALSAPTGKAARKLEDSLIKQIDSVDIKFQESLINIPCLTLHKLLESSSAGFGKNKNNLLNFDLLVIDEMSMVSLGLMKGLLDATMEDTQLVLVGDYNQLPPIESGSIWHKLHEYDTAKKFAKNSTKLCKIYRNKGDVVLLSKILCEQGFHAFWHEISSAGEKGNIKLYRSSSDNIPSELLSKMKLNQNIISNESKMLNDLLNSNSISDRQGQLYLQKQLQTLLASLGNLLVLCPTRNGKWSVSEIHKLLLGENIVSEQSKWPQGTPVMCSENQNELGLANGDLGIVVGEGEERRLVFKTTSKIKKSSIKCIHPARVKSIEPALAMTIHKAQGSESKQVIVLWPDNTHQLLKQNTLEAKNDIYSKRLLYTAITRAQNGVDILIKA